MKFNTGGLFKDLNGNDYGTTVVCAIANEDQSGVMENEDGNPIMVNITNNNEAMTAGFATLHSLSVLKADTFEDDQIMFRLMEKIRGADGGEIDMSKKEKDFAAKALFNNPIIPRDFRGQVLSSIK